MSNEKYGCDDFKKAILELNTDKWVQRALEKKDIVVSAWLEKELFRPTAQDLIDGVEGYGRLIIRAERSLKAQKLLDGMPACFITPIKSAEIKVRFNTFSPEYIFLDTVEYIEFALHSIKRNLILSKSVEEKIMSEIDGILAQAYRSLNELKSDCYIGDLKAFNNELQAITKGHTSRTLPYNLGLCKKLHENIHAACERLVE